MVYAFLVGRFRFSQIEEQARSTEQLADEFKLNIFRGTAIYQATTNLMGRNECLDVANASDLIASNERTESVAPASDLCALVLAYHFQNIPVMEKYVAAVEKSHHSVKGHSTERFVFFYIGMSNYLVYKCSGKRSNPVPAR